MKMTSAQVVETSVTNHSSFQNYPHPDDHTIQTTTTICLRGLRAKRRIHLELPDIDYDIEKGHAN